MRECPFHLPWGRLIGGLQLLLAAALFVCGGPRRATKLYRSDARPTIRRLQRSICWSVFTPLGEGRANRGRVELPRAG
ncbi:hypothetical protein [Streptomyces sp. CB02959]|uniref:hypothetical protein n=1 Tax=Streptomyces sp. CB02959 TaxID=2020330 RepID=UPI0015E159B0|nr:hypothetical protein [Streptomyces sp. CB02959]